MQITYQYYTSMPLTLTITQIKRMQNLLAEDPKNVILVHCQENMTRSVVFLTSYLYLTGKESDIPSGLEIVWNRLGLKDQEWICASQHNILRNVAHFYQDPACINK